MAEPESGKAALQVTVVAPEQQVWQGSATTLSLRTTEGEMGVLPGHESTFSVLVPCVVQVHTPERGPHITDSPHGPVLRLAIDGGFVSIHDDHVSVLAEQVLFPADIDTAAEQQTLVEAEKSGDRAASRLARAHLTLAGAPTAER